MFKRNKGYLLLTMLVLTGLAGRIHSDTLSGKERRLLTKELKTSKTEFTESVESLTTKQFNFKAAKNSWSIKECVYKLVSVESNLWKLTKTCLQQEPVQQRRTFSDEQLITISNQPGFTELKELNFKNMKHALKVFKNESAEIHKYVITSTENIRAHVAQTSIGNLDAYQLMMLNAIFAKYYTQQIEQIKSNPDFPK